MAYTDSNKDEIMRKIEWARDHLSIILRDWDKPAEGRGDSMSKEVGRALDTLGEARSWIRE